jgi:murein DD-endopeptidase MepM/ murein hydrolase activator NlpD
MSAFSSFAAGRRAMCARLGLLTVALVAVMLAPTGSAQASRADDWTWPLSPQPPVARYFDPPDSPWGAGNRGVDLVGSVGQPVSAIAAGVVTYAGVLAGRGVVVVRHGALRSTYEPVGASVAVGQDVAGGQPIGMLQAVGSHCLPDVCLHLGLLRGSEYLDPLSVLGPLDIRLKPLGASGWAAAAAAAASAYSWPTVR